MPLIKQEAHLTDAREARGGQMRSQARCGRGLGVVRGVFTVCAAIAGLGWREECWNNGDDWSSTTWDKSLENEWARKVSVLDARA